MARSIPVWAHRSSHTHDDHPQRTSVPSPYTPLDRKQTWNHVCIFLVTCVDEFVCLFMYVLIIVLLDISLLLSECCFKPIPNLHEEGLTHLLSQQVTQLTVCSFKWFCCSLCCCNFLSTWSVVIDDNDDDDTDDDNDYLVLATCHCCITLMVVQYCSITVVTLDGWNIKVLSTTRTCKRWLSLSVNFDNLSCICLTLIIKQIITNNTSHSRWEHCSCGRRPVYIEGTHQYNLVSQLRGRRAHYDHEYSCMHIMSVSALWPRV